MRFEKLFGLAGAASLAACSPQGDKAPESQPGVESTLREDGAGNVEIMLPEEIVPSDNLNNLPELLPQYSPEEEAKIRSGTTQELDGMDQAELDQLGGER
jgi:hypothetical protein